jgi:hypothetical protein
MGCGSSVREVSGASSKFSSNSIEVLKAAQRGDLD